MTKQESKEEPKDLTIGKADRFVNQAVAEEIVSIIQRRLRRVRSFEDMTPEKLIELLHPASKIRVKKLIKFLENVRI